KHYSSIHCLRQLKRRVTVIQVARSQNSINYAPAFVPQSVQLEAEKPPCTGFAKVSSFFTKQSHSSMTNGFAHRYRLGINKVKFAFTHTSSRFKQPANEWAESVQSSNPLLIRTDQRESRSEVRSNKSIGLLERIYSEKAL